METCIVPNHSQFLQFVRVLLGEIQKNPPSLNFTSKKLKITPWKNFCLHRCGELKYFYRNCDKKNFEHKPTKNNELYEF